MHSAFGEDKRFLGMVERWEEEVTGSMHNYLVPLKSHHLVNYQLLLVFITYR